ncbi:MAG TPA: hypothetical protein DDW50_12385 [Firmicutes bacterium]|jgi:alpha-mannosidase|nr:hypothetical protein [Bacillota bacterium]
MDKNHFLRTSASFIGKVRAVIPDLELPLPVWQYREAEYLAPKNTRYLTEWRSIQQGEIWTGSTAFFKSTITVDESFRDHCTQLIFDNMGESLVYINGTPRQGLDINRKMVTITDRAVPGESFEILVESTLQWQKSAHAAHLGQEYGPHIFKKAALVAINPSIASFVADVDFLYEYYLQFEERNVAELIDYVHQHVQPFSPRPELLIQINEVTEYLKLHFFTGKHGEMPTLQGIGHSHLDLAYLWPAKETVRKCARTFSNMLQLLEKYPTFHFTQSQPILYQLCKQYYPELYQQIKEYIRQGRWEVVGGMYVESDCNIPSGESLIRQFLYGQKFLKEEFGEISDICWLPDTFGYSAALPQIFQKCGIRYFYTFKLQKNTVNEFPYNLFTWEGIDGSKVISVLDPFSGYDGKMELPDLCMGLKKYHQKNNYPQIMYLFGYGDGGGGTTPEMIEKIERLNKAPGPVNLSMGTAHEFFERINQTKTDLPNWQGELYFEWHQGTYTSQAQIKHANRKLEFLYRDVEILMSLSGYDAQKHQKIHEGWELILFNQFHDILPGSCLTEGRQEAMEKYKTAFEIGQNLCDQTLTRLFPASTRNSEAPKQIVAVNTFSFSRSEYIEAAGIPAGALITDLTTRSSVACQRLRNGHVLFTAKDIPSFGYKVFQIQVQNTECPSQTGDGLLFESPEEYWLENRILKVLLSKSTGNIVSILDKENQREILNGQGNYFELFSEVHDFYDAWNINEQTLKNPQIMNTVSAFNILENGPLLATVEIVRNFGQSQIRQVISFTAETRRIDFETEISWAETEKLLKVAFDLDVYATKATYDIAYGNIERSTRNNTSWEQAQYEVSAHKWADLSENDFGVALLNDCKYGYDIKNNKMRLTLLKAPRYPDKTCDMGTHHFRYALLIHSGGWRAARVDREGYCFNDPLLITYMDKNSQPGIKTCDSFVQLHGDGVFLETLKHCEDNSGDLLIRIYENHGSLRKIAIELKKLSAAKVFECDMLENKLWEIPFSNEVIKTTLKPYEIKTLRLSQHA